MKIVHICPFYTPAIGGVKQVVEELAKRQIEQGHEVHVFTSDWDKERRIKNNYEIIEGVHVHRFRHLFKIGNFVSFWPGVFFEILKEDFDVIHSHVFGHPHFVLASLAGKLKGTPHVHTTHCPWTDAYRSIPARMGLFLSYNIFSRFASKLTDKIIAITPWEIEFIKSNGGEKDKIVVLPNGMDKKFFSKVKNNGFKKKHKIKGKMVLFFGRLNVVKGPDKFVEIAKLVLKERKDVTFVIRGPDEGMMEIVKRKIGNEKRIIFLDATRDRGEIIEMYQAADVFVLPSYREGLPLTLFEAMAAGCPIVASPVNGVPYEMKEPENGFLVKYGDNSGFAKRIIELLDSKKKRDKVSKNNIKYSKRYSWDIITEKTMKVYGGLVNKR